MEGPGTTGARNLAVVSRVAAGFGLEIPVLSGDKEDIARHRAALEDLLLRLGGRAQHGLYREGVYKPVDVAFLAQKVAEIAGRNVGGRYDEILRGLWPAVEHSARGREKDGGGKERETDVERECREGIEVCVGLQEGTGDGVPTFAVLIAADKLATFQRGECVAKIRFALLWALRAARIEVPKGKRLGYTAEAIASSVVALVDNINNGGEGRSVPVGKKQAGNEQKIKKKTKQKQLEVCRQAGCEEPLCKKTAPEHAVNAAAAALKEEAQAAFLKKEEQEKAALLRVLSEGGKKARGAPKVGVKRGVDDGGAGGSAPPGAAAGGVAAPKAKARRAPAVEGGCARYAAVVAQVAAGFGLEIPVLSEDEEDVVKHRAALEELLLRLGGRAQPGLYREGVYQPADVAFLAKKVADIAGRNVGGRYDEVLRGLWPAVVESARGREKEGGGRERETDVERECREGIEVCVGLQADVRTGPPPLEPFPPRGGPIPDPVLTGEGVPALVGLQEANGSNAKPMAPACAEPSQDGAGDGVPTFAVLIAADKLAIVQRGECLTKIRYALIWALRAAGIEVPKGKRLGYAAEAIAKNVVALVDKESTLEVTEGQILSQSPADATSSR